MWSRLSTAIVYTGCEECHKIKELREKRGGSWKNLALIDWYRPIFNVVTTVAARRLVYNAARYIQNENK